MTRLDLAAYDAAVFRGHLTHLFIAAGLSLLLLTALWAWEEWRVRSSQDELGWLGVGCLAMVGMAGLTLLTLGVL